MALNPGLVRFSPDVFPQGATYAARLLIQDDNGNPEPNLTLYSFSGAIRDDTIDRGGQVLYQLAETDLTVPTSGQIDIVISAATTSSVVTDAGANSRRLYLEVDLTNPDTEVVTTFIWPLDVVHHYNDGAAIEPPGPGYFGSPNLLYIDSNSVNRVVDGAEDNVISGPYSIAYVGASDRTLATGFAIVNNSGSYYLVNPSGVPISITPYDLDECKTFVSDPSGDFIYYRKFYNDGSGDIAEIRKVGYSGGSDSLVHTAASDGDNLAISPDGTQILFNEGNDLVLADIADVSGSASVIKTVVGTLSSGDNFWFCNSGDHVGYVLEDGIARTFEAIDLSDPSTIAATQTVEDSTYRCFLGLRDVEGSISFFFLVEENFNDESSVGNLAFCPAVNPESPYTTVALWVAGPLSEFQGFSRNSVWVPNDLGADYLP